MALALPASAIAAPETTDVALLPVAVLTHPSRTPQSTATSGPTPTPGPHCEAQPVTILGTDESETIEGTSGSDVIDARGGDDVIHGRGGYDIICGGPGNDTFDVTEGTHAWLIGDIGNDTFNGSDGVDSIEAGHGDDYVDAGIGDDNIFGTDGIDEMHGGEGNDEITSYDERANTDGSGSDTITGGAGDDLITGGPDSDNLDGGSGRDFLRYPQFSSEVGLQIDLAAGTARRGTEVDVATGFETVFGTPFADELLGNDAENYLAGLEGDDTIDGRGGDDFIHADTTFCGSSTPWTADADTIHGGSGNDTIHAGHVCGGAGGDDYVDGQDGNDVIYGGVGDDEFLGGIGNDAIGGGGGNDQLLGGLGNDDIGGGAGDDQLSGAEGDDDLRGMEGIDTGDGGDGFDWCTEIETMSNCEEMTTPSDCEDGSDNDGREGADYPSDPDCTSSEDDYEGFPPSDEDGPGEPIGLTIEHEVGTGSFSGRFHHTEYRCDQDQRVTLWRKKATGDVSVGETRIDGVWQITLDRVAKGRYYVTSDPTSFTTDKGDTVECPGLSSPVIAGQLLPLPTLTGGVVRLDATCQFTPTYCITLFARPGHLRGVVWIQRRTRPLDERHCINRSVTEVGYPEGLKITRVSPLGTKRLQQESRMVTRLSVRYGGTVSERWRAYPRRVWGFFEPDRQRFGLGWAGAFDENLMLVNGATVSWVKRRNEPDADDFTVEVIEKSTIRRPC